MSVKKQRLKAWFVRTGLRLIGATWRVKESIPADCTTVIGGQERAVIAFWHGQMFPVWYRFGGHRFAALVSGSADGELLAQYLERVHGYNVIRGSSSKGGSEALESMVELLGKRSCLITPDGPRGPVHIAKPGAMVAARRAGVPIMLVGWHCRKKKSLRSWDRMEIPLPFSKIYIRYCKFVIPNSIAARITDNTLDRLGARLTSLARPMGPKQGGGVA